MYQPHHQQHQQQPPVIKPIVIKPQCVQNSTSPPNYTSHAQQLTLFHSNGGPMKNGNENNNNLFALNSTRDFKSVNSGRSWGSRGAEPTDGVTVGAFMNSACKQRSLDTSKQMTSSVSGDALNYWQQKHRRQHLSASGYVTSFPKKNGLICTPFGKALVVSVGDYAFFVILRDDELLVPSDCVHVTVWFDRQSTCFAPSSWVTLTETEMQVLSTLCGCLHNRHAVKYSEIIMSFPPAHAQMSGSGDSQAPLLPLAPPPIPLTHAALMSHSPLSFTPPPPISQLPPLPLPPALAKPVPFHAMQAVSRQPPSLSPAPPRLTSSPALISGPPSLSPAPFHAPSPDLRSCYTDLCPVPPSYTAAPNSASQSPLPYTPPPVQSTDVFRVASELLPLGGGQCSDVTNLDQHSNVSNMGQHYGVLHPEQRAKSVSHLGQNPSVSHLGQSPSVSHLGQSYDNTPLGQNLGVLHPKLNPSVSHFGHHPGTQQPFPHQKSNVDHVAPASNATSASRASNNNSRVAATNSAHVTSTTTTTAPNVTSQSKRPECDNWILINSYFFPSVRRANACLIPYVMAASYLGYNYERRALSVTSAERRLLLELLPTCFMSSDGRRDDRLVAVTSLRQVIPRLQVDRLPRMSFDDVGAAEPTPRSVAVAEPETMGQQVSTHTASQEMNAVTSYPEQWPQSGQQQQVTSHSGAALPVLPVPSSRGLSTDVLSSTSTGDTAMNPSLYDTSQCDSGDHLTTDHAQTASNAAIVNPTTSSDTLAHQYSVPSSTCQARASDVTCSDAAFAHRSDAGYDISRPLTSQTLPTTNKLACDAQAPTASDTTSGKRRLRQQTLKEYFSPETPPDWLDDATEKVHYTDDGQRRRKKVIKKRKRSHTPFTHNKRHKKMPVSDFRAARFQQNNQIAAAAGSGTFKHEMKFKPQNDSGFTDQATTGTEQLGTTSVTSHVIAGTDTATNGDDLDSSTVRKHGLRSLRRRSGIGQYSELNSSTDSKETLTCDATAPSTSCNYRLKRRYVRRKPLKSSKRNAVASTSADTAAETVVKQDGVNAQPNSVSPRSKRRYGKWNRGSYLVPRRGKGNRPKRNEKQSPDVDRSKITAGKKRKRSAAAVLSSTDTATDAPSCAIEFPAPIKPPVTPPSPGESLSPASSPRPDALARLLFAPRPHSTASEDTSTYDETSVMSSLPAAAEMLDFPEPVADTPTDTVADKVTDTVADTVATAPSSPERPENDDATTAPSTPGGVRPDLSIRTALTIIGTISKIRHGDISRARKLRRRILTDIGSELDSLRSSSASSAQSTPRRGKVPTSSRPGSVQSTPLRGKVPTSSRPDSVHKSPKGRRHVEKSPRRHSVDKSPHRRNLQSSLQHRNIQTSPRRGKVPNNTCRTRILNRPRGITAKDVSNSSAPPVTSAATASKQPSQSSGGGGAANIDDLILNSLDSTLEQSMDLEDSFAASSTATSSTVTSSRAKREERLRLSTVTVDDQTAASAAMAVKMPPGRVIAELDLTSGEVKTGNTLRDTRVMIKKSGKNGEQSTQESNNLLKHSNATGNTDTPAVTTCQCDVTMSSLSLSMCDDTTSARLVCGKCNKEVASFGCDDETATGNTADDHVMSNKTATGRAHGDYPTFAEPLHRELAERQCGDVMQTTTSERDGCAATADDAADATPMRESESTESVFEALFARNFLTRQRPVRKPQRQRDGRYARAKQQRQREADRALRLAFQRRNPRVDVSRSLRVTLQREAWLDNWFLQW